MVQTTVRFVLLIIIGCLSSLSASSRYHQLAYALTSRKKPPIAFKETPTPHQKLDALFSAPLFSEPHVSSQESLGCILDAVKSYTQDHEDILPTSTVLDQTASAYLELIAGRDAPQSSFVPSIDYTITSMGRMMLMRLLLDPLTDIPILQKRQNAIMHLATNDELYNDVFRQLSSIAQSESSLLSFLLPHEPLFEETIAGSYLAGLEYLHRSPLLLSGYNGIMTLLSTVTTGGFLYLAYRVTKARKQNATLQEPKKALKTMFLWAFAIMGIYSTVSGKWYDYVAFSYIRYRLHLLKKLPRLINKSRTLLNTFLADNLPKTPELDEVTTLLDHIAFDSEEKRIPLSTYLTLHDGILLSSLACLNKHQAHIKIWLMLVGLIDALMSVATLLRKYPCDFCATSFTKPGSGPSCTLQSAWNPRIGMEHAARNSIELGTENAPRGLIITGNNAGGKSTILKTFCYSLILSQTCGVAPAQAAVITPFSFITTYGLITDDVGNKRSLFMQAAAQSGALLKRINELNTHEYAAVVLDEAFNNTNYERGQALAYALGHSLADAPQALTLFATHYPEVTALEKDTNGILHNVHVHAPHTNSSLPAYTLIDGPVASSNAWELFQQYAYPQDVIQIIADQLEAQP